METQMSDNQITQSPGASRPTHAHTHPPRLSPAQQSDITTICETSPARRQWRKRRVKRYSLAL